MADRRAAVSASCEPDLFIDGVPCCDQVVSHELARHGLIRPSAEPAPLGRLRAELTAEGEAALAAHRRIPA